jgi:diacylglycerol kinase (ATP)
MAKKEQSFRSLGNSLRRKQRKHQSLLDKVEKTAARLERRKIKLLALESRIADLERRTAETGDQRTGQGDSDGARRHALLIFNPTSGRNDENNAQRLSQIVNSLRAHGIQAHIGLKTSGGAARSLAREAVRSGHQLVVVAAGDGTIEEVASQLAGSTTVLGIVPIGTMNNIARSLGVPLGIDDACALIGMGTNRHIDIGRVISNERGDVQHFLEGAGVGLSALAARAGQAAEKRQWRMIPKALREYFETKPGHVHAQIDDMVVEASSNLVTVSNAPLMGDNLLISPDAKMDDGLLDVRVYDGMSSLALAKHCLASSKGSAETIKTYRGRRVRITTEEPVLTNSDKDVTRQARVVEIEIVPGALSMIVGNGIALTVPVGSAPDAHPLACDLPGTNGHRRIEKALEDQEEPSEEMSQ